MNILGKIRMVSRFWRYRRRTEKESVRFLLDQDLAGTTVLDIGANRGIYTYWMSKQVGDLGRVISFEPQPELGDFLLDLKKSFKLENVVIENKGLSDKEGKFDIFRGFVGSGGARLAQKGEELPENSDLHKVEVEVTTLDTFFQGKELKNLAFIKCDVEGHELSVFKGGEKTLRKHMPTILFECGHEEAQAGEIFSFLTNMGYKGFFIIDGKKIDYKEFDKHPYRKPTESLRNYMFVKK
ncbi:FkbM family methyltransferase [Pontibacter pamirensis]|uniref:FkbM family methyltransferase n=1 Tax=Pontibacter pamirensis TaxID=2562824 RepID=UPI0013896BC8|nr:FkbM family methyltransferase [Pontibacter pamirensis]